MKLSWDAVFFDLDGTLVDTATDLRLSLNQLCLENGRPGMTPEEFLPHTGRGVRVFIEEVLGVTPRDASFRGLRDRFLEIYSEMRHHHSDFFPGIKELLQDFLHHSYSWGIVTGKWRSLTLPLLAHLQLNCPCLVCGDDTAHPKPAPDPLLKACSSLSLDPVRCLYVGDEIRDYQAASSCGMSFLGVSWGYQCNVLFGKQVNAIVSSVSELRHFIFQ